MDVISLQLPLCHIKAKEKKIAEKTLTAPALFGCKSTPCAPCEAVLDLKSDVCFKSETRTDQKVRMQVNMRVTKREEGSTTGGPKGQSCEEVLSNEADRQRSANLLRSVGTLETTMNRMIRETFAQEKMPPLPGLDTPLEVSQEVFISNPVEINALRAGIYDKGLCEGCQVTHDFDVPQCVDTSGKVTLTYKPQATAGSSAPQEEGEPCFEVIRESACLALKEKLKEKIRGLMNVNEPQLKEVADHLGTQVCAKASSLSTAVDWKSGPLESLLTTDPQKKMITFDMTKDEYKENINSCTPCTVFLTMRPIGQCRPFNAAGTTDPLEIGGEVVLTPSPNGASCETVVRTSANKIKNEFIKKARDALQARVDELTKTWGVRQKLMPGESGDPAAVADRVAEEFFGKAVEAAPTVKYVTGAASETKKLDLKHAVEADDAAKMAIFPCCNVDEVVGECLRCDRDGQKDKIKIKFQLDKSTDPNPLPAKSCKSAFELKKSDLRAGVSGTQKTKLTEGAIKAIEPKFISSGSLLSLPHQATDSSPFPSVDVALADSDANAVCREGKTITICEDPKVDIATADRADITGAARFKIVDQIQCKRKGGPPPKILRSVLTIKSLGDVGSRGILDIVDSAMRGVPRTADIIGLSYLLEGSDRNPSPVFRCLKELSISTSRQVMAGPGKVLCEIQTPSTFNVAPEFREFLFHGREPGPKNFRAIEAAPDPKRADPLFPGAPAGSADPALEIVFKDIEMVEDFVNKPEHTGLFDTCVDCEVSCESVDPSCVPASSATALTTFKYKFKKADLPATHRHNPPSGEKPASWPTPADFGHRDCPATATSFKAPAPAAAELLKKCGQIPSGVNFGSSPALKAFVGVASTEFNGPLDTVTATDNEKEIEIKKDLPLGDLGLQDCASCQPSVTFPDAIPECVKKQGTDKFWTAKITLNQDWNADEKGKTCKEVIQAMKPQILNKVTEMIQQRNQMPTLEYGVGKTLPGADTETAAEEVYKKIEEKAETTWPATQTGVIPHLDNGSPKEWPVEFDYDFGYQKFKMTQCRKCKFQITEKCPACKQGDTTTSFDNSDIQFSFENEKEAAQDEHTHCRKAIETFFSPLKTACTADATKKDECQKTALSEALIQKIDSASGGDADPTAHPLWFSRSLLPDKDGSAALKMENLKASSRDLLEGKGVFEACEAGNGGALTLCDPCAWSLKIAPWKRKPTDGSLEPDTTNEGKKCMPEHLDRHDHEYSFDIVLEASFTASGALGCWESIDSVARMPSSLREQANYLENKKIAKLNPAPDVTKTALDFLADPRVSVEREKLLNCLQAIKNNVTPRAGCTLDSSSADCPKALKGETGTNNAATTCKVKLEKSKIITKSGAQLFHEKVLQKPVPGPCKECEMKCEVSIPDKHCAGWGETTSTKVRLKIETKDPETLDPDSRLEGVTCKDWFYKHRPHDTRTHHRSTDWTKILDKCSFSAIRTEDIDDDSFKFGESIAQQIINYVKSQSTGGNHIVNSLTGNAPPQQPLNLQIENFKQRLLKFPVVDPSTISYCDPCQLEFSLPSFPVCGPDPDIPLRLSSKIIGSPDPTGMKCGEALKQLLNHKVETCATGPPSSVGGLDFSQLCGLNTELDARLITWLSLLDASGISRPALEGTLKRRLAEAFAEEATKTGTSSTEPTVISLANVLTQVGKEIPPLDISLSSVAGFSAPKCVTCSLEVDSSKCPSCYPPADASSPDVTSLSDRFDTSFSYRLKLSLSKDQRLVTCKHATKAYAMAQPDPTRPGEYKDPEESRIYVSSEVERRWGEKGLGPWGGFNPFGSTSMEEPKSVPVDDPFKACGLPSTLRELQSSLPECESCKITVTPERLPCTPSSGNIPIEGKIQITSGHPKGLGCLREEVIAAATKTEGLREALTACISDLAQGKSLMDAKCEIEEPGEDPSGAGAGDKFRWMIDGSETQKSLKLKFTRLTLHADHLGEGIPKDSAACTPCTIQSCTVTQKRCRGADEQTPLEFELKLKEGESISKSCAAELIPQDGLLSPARLMAACTGRDVTPAQAVQGAKEMRAVRNHIADNLGVTIEERHRAMSSTSPSSLSGGDLRNQIPGAERTLNLDVDARPSYVNTFHTAFTACQDCEMTFQTFNIVGKCIDATGSSDSKLSFSLKKTKDAEPGGRDCLKVFHDNHLQFKSDIANKVKEWVTTNGLTPDRNVGRFTETANVIYDALENKLQSPPSGQSTSWAPASHGSHPNEMFCEDLVLNKGDIHEYANYRFRLIPAIDLRACGNCEMIVVGFCPHCKASVEVPGLTAIFLRPNTGNTPTDNVCFNTWETYFSGTHPATMVDADAAKTLMEKNKQTRTADFDSTLNSRSRECVTRECVGIARRVLDVQEISDPTDLSEAAKRAALERRFREMPEGGALEIPLDPDGISSGVPSGCSADIPDCANCKVKILEDVDAPECFKEGEANAKFTVRLQFAPREKFGKKCAEVVTHGPVVKNAITEMLRNLRTDTAPSTVTAESDHLSMRLIDGIIEKAQEYDNRHVLITSSKTQTFSAADEKAVTLDITQEDATALGVDECGDCRLYVFITQKPHCIAVPPRNNNRIAFQMDAHFSPFETGCQDAIKRARANMKVFLGSPRLDSEPLAKDLVPVTPSLWTKIEKAVDQTWLGAQRRGTVDMRTRKLKDEVELSLLQDNALLVSQLNTGVSRVC
eukprot:Cvel_11086.t1-p1 / transcript=Cvel_11086.t1 / gene=Cvel_11086 / organism=Chromera_velia_CCMP2878 / gene_product=hypothetical protein / transcript_product=hypothetical protein / location=Cvel_scaffold686:240-19953(-) / protein_length=2693 / sequence_SO=supercontig / SO=protein_coding / is_pseudo=false